MPTACPDCLAIAELINAATAEARALPRLVAWPVELPLLTPEDSERRRAEGWLGAGLFTAERDGRLVSLVDVRALEDKGQIGWFATHPDYRRLGLATECFQRACEYLRAAGVTSLQTEGFVDSRVVSACGFLEASGLTVRAPQQQNIVMQIDMDAYEPVSIVLPADFRIESLRPEWVPQWLQTKDRVFGGSTPADWFEKTFSHRWDFEYEGWMTLWRGDEMIGISGTDLFRDPEHRENYSGCQIEYVGVVEGHRGLRLGEMLVCSCLNYAKALKVKPCQLITQIFRVPAVTLYERLGFRHVREIRVYECVSL
jgi:ribosomal protein S18 acetylase RimI-like enzyme